MMRRAGRPLVAIIATLASLAAAAAGTPLAIHIHSERAMFQVLVSPGTVGTDSFILQLMSGEGDLLPVKQATLILTLPERGIGPLERKAELGADRYWHVEDVALPFAGRWHMRIEAQTPFRNIMPEDDFDVPAK
jgi:copper transport protein